MPSITESLDDYSDEDIFFRKKTVCQKFVDSDEENAPLNAVNSEITRNDEDSDNDVVFTTSDSSKRKRRIVTRDDSESEDEKSKNLDSNSKQRKVNKRSSKLRRKTASSANGTTEDEDSQGNILSAFDKLRQSIGCKSSVSTPGQNGKSAAEEPVGSHSPMKLLQETSASTTEHMAPQERLKNLFADKDLYDAESSDDESKKIETSKQNVHKEKNASNNKSNLFADKDLYDAESSDEESRANQERQMEINISQCSPENEKGAKQRSRKQIARKEKKQHLQGNEKELGQIRSETQRIVRESRVSLPYHRPRQRTLAEFLQRRPVTPVVAKSVRMSAEQLTLMEQELKKRAKQAEEFYKSSSDEEEIAQSSGGKTDQPAVFEASDNTEKQSDIQLNGDKTGPPALDEQKVCENEQVNEEKEHPKSLSDDFSSVLSQKLNDIIEERKNAFRNEEALLSLEKELKSNPECEQQSETKEKENILPHNQSNDTISKGISQNIDEHEEAADLGNQKLSNSSVEHVGQSDGFGKTFMSSLHEMNEDSDVTDTAGTQNVVDETVAKDFKLNFPSNVEDSNSIIIDTKDDKILPESISSTFTSCSDGDEDCAVISSGKDKPVIKYDPDAIDSQDLVLRFTESMTNDLLDNNTSTCTTNPSKASNNEKSISNKQDNNNVEQVSSEKVCRFNFKKDLSNLLWKESWNCPASVLQRENASKENSSTKELNKLSGDDVRNKDTECARMMMEGEDAQSTCPDIFKETSTTTLDSCESKSQTEGSRNRSDVDIPKITMEGEDARSMCIANTTEDSAENKKQRKVVPNNTAECLMLDDDNARSMCGNNGTVESTHKSNHNSDDKMLKSREITDTSFEMDRNNKDEKYGISPENITKRLNDTENSNSATPDNSSQDAKVSKRSRKKHNNTGSMFFSKLLHGEDVLKSEITKKTEEKTGTPVAKIMPRLTGSPNKMIDLDATPSPHGVLQLMNRFLKHSTVKKPKLEASKVELSIVTAEEGKHGVPEVKKDTVTVLLGTEEHLQPGAKLQCLKQQLAQQMAQRREQEWNKRLQEAEAETKERELDEKSDCGLFDDEELLDDDMTSSESEEEEEEEEVRIPKQPRIKSAFVDDEAEVSEESNGHISDEEEEEDDEEEEEEEDGEEEEEKKNGTLKVEESELQPTEKQTGKLKRIKTFDPFESQDEDSDCDGRSALDDLDVAMTIPPYQPGGALTPPIQPLAEEQFVPSIIPPTLPPPISGFKEDAVISDTRSQPFSEEPSPTSRLLLLCSVPDGRDPAELDDELLKLCSGKFSTQPLEPSQDGELCSGKFSSQITQEEGLPISQDPESLPPTQPLLPSLDLASMQTSQASQDVRTSPELMKSRPSMVIESSDDEDDRLAEKRKETKKKLRKKLDFSDDESSGLSSEEEEEGPRVIEYDSEENEVDMTVMKDKPKSAKDFFENEAELSESEWGSADEDERDLDTLELEEGDADQLDQQKVKEQLDKIHMRRLLDEDQKEVRKLQELLLEDGELHSEGGGRQRQFRWKNLNNMDGFGDRGPSDDEAMGEDGAEDAEDELEWRRQRFERESFLEEHKEKVVAVEMTEIVVAETLKLKLRRPKSHSQPSSLQARTKRGSFLARSEVALARIAQLTRSTSDSGVLAPTNSRNFVFATLSPEKDENKAEKRKAPEAELSAIKRPRLSEGLLDLLSY